ncbi:hypothetical protein [Hyphomonas sp.]|uniref:hypothetical protein n=1 Tax=Hyphomonas sp. TaxID=87 RepID=UPI00356657EC
MAISGMEVLAEARDTTLPDGAKETFDARESNDGFCPKLPVEAKRANGGFAEMRTLAASECLRSQRAISPFFAARQQKRPPQARVS